ncbi:MAG: hypothetical protein OYH77_00060 [Pseudomonadota bacterium]|nr:hypothetical protein [Pseudomonadota bacterium]
MKYVYLILLACPLLLLGSSNIKPIMPLVQPKSDGLPLMPQALLGSTSNLNAKEARKTERWLPKQYKKIFKDFNLPLSLEVIAKQLELQRYYLQQLRQAMSDSEKEQTIVKKLRTSQNRLQQFANHILPRLGDKRDVAKITFHKHIARYLLATTRAQQNKIAQDIRRDSYRLLPPNLKRTATLLLAVHAAEKTKALRRFQLDGSPHVAIVSYLHAARLTMKSKKKFSTFIHRASRLAVNLYPREKSALLAYSVSLWRQQAASQQNWNTPPFELKVFRTLPDVLPLIERSALSDWSHGHKKRAVHMYRKLARDKNSTRYRKQLYLRYLRLAKTYYTEASNSRFYDNALHQLYVDYRADRAKQQTQPLGGITMAQLQKQHFAFMVKELLKAKSTTYTKELKTQTIAMAKKLAITFPNLKERLYTEIALVYASMRLYTKSAAVYLMLSNNYKQRQESYLRQAISMQSLYVSYPAEPVFAKRWTIPAQYITDYAKLTQMYASLDKLQSKVDWQVKSHYGLLLVAASQEERAVDLWTMALAQNSTHKYAKSAALYALPWLEQHKKWSKLERLAILLTKRKVQLSLPKPLHVYLETALMQQGINAEHAGNNALAIVKFNAYVKLNKAPQKEFATYRLTRLYKKEKLHTKFYDTLFLYVRTYPQGKHYRRSLLEAAQYATMTAEVEHAIFFYRTFLQRYPNSQQEPSIRQKLFSMFKAKGDVDSMLTELKLLFRASAHDKNKLHLAQEIIAIEFEHGVPSNALVMINWVLAANDVSDDVARGKAYHQKVALLIGSRSFAHLDSDTHASLRGLKQEIRSAQARARKAAPYNLALALVALVEASASPRAAVTVDAVKRSTDVTALLRGLVNKYNVGRNNYLQVCKLDNRSLCVQSLYRLARFAEHHLAEVEKVVIANSLEEKITAPFNAERASALKNIKDTIVQAHNKSLAIVKQGLATPLVADQVTWMEKNDLDFQDRGASAYFQLSI